MTVDAALNGPRPSEWCLRNHHLAIYSYLSSNGINYQFCSIGNFHFAAFGEYFGAHIAAGFGPLVVLLGEHGADEADDGVAAGEDPGDVGPSPDLAVQPRNGRNVFTVTCVSFVSLVTGEPNQNA
jgi:hypothetical protein